MVRELVVHVAGAERALRLPSSASSRSRVRRTVTSEYSAATKKPFNVLMILGIGLYSAITAILTIVLSEFPGARPISVLLSRNGKL